MQRSAYLACVQIFDILSCLNKLLSTLILSFKRTDFSTCTSSACLNVQTIFFFLEVLRCEQPCLCENKIVYTHSSILFLTESFCRQLNKNSNLKGIQVVMMKHLHHRKKIRLKCCLVSAMQVQSINYNNVVNKKYHFRPKKKRIRVLKRESVECSD